MPYDIFKDNQKKDSALRYVFVPAMMLIIIFLTIVLTLIIISIGRDGESFYELMETLKKLLYGGGSLLGAKVLQKYFEVRDKFTKKKPVETIETNPASSIPAQPVTPTPTVQPSPVVSVPVETPSQDLYRSMPDRNLTSNFRLYEFIEAHPSGNLTFVLMNWKNIKEFNESNYRLMAAHMQWVRDIVNQRYKDRNGGKDIRILITSAWRCVEWELRQKRDGSSRHTIDAVDWVPVTNDVELAAKILREMHSEWYDTVRGHQGGLALGNPKYDQQGKMITAGFMHLDFGRPRRWTYNT